MTPLGCIIQIYGAIIQGNNGLAIQVGQTNADISFGKINEPRQIVANLFILIIIN
jgi:hypothetical protein